MPEFTLEQELTAISEVLARYGGTDPDDLGAVITLAALGLTNGAWRNTCVEDWHAGSGPLTDGDMLRINAATSRGVRQRMLGWTRECELGAEAGSRTDTLSRVYPEDLLPLMERLYRWLVRPDRMLPTGTTLGELAGACGGDLAEYEDCADRALSGFLTGAEERGVAYAFLRAAAHGAGACRHWWGHPDWPRRVGAFRDAMGDPGHPHWGADGR
ncbi:hypothetical protein [Streptomyces sp. NPDC102360]|uniref:hypothetical protein n=1 Tax=Streptomyces sp. NPDC102360 TaxID=3366160 RepID=UPI003829A56D